jgi:membrane associated rhomboid family serine protease
MNNSILNDFKYAWSRPNNAVIQIIIINVIIFVGLFFISLLRYAGLEAVVVLIQNQFIIPSDLSEFIFRPWTALTYAFNHAGVFHIFFNMLVLYWFGQLFVEYLGSQKLVNLYVISAIAGAFVFLIVYNLIPSLGYANMVGASGAVYGIVVATATFLPNYRFHLLFIGPVKIMYIALFTIFISIISLDRGQNVGGDLAHLTGAAVGFLYARQIQRGREMGTWVFRSMEFLKSFFQPRPKIKVSHRQARPDSKKGTGNEPVQARPKSTVSQNEIDAILDKISEKGYDSLSKDEKEKLFNASKK